VHGLPAVEIYGILEGQFQLWHKPMNRRGARTWQCQTLGAGDWVEVEPLHCHFGFWLTPQGLGTVIKAAGEGELAGVGKIGTAGKTTCKDCNVRGQCLKHPRMLPIIEEYAKPSRSAITIRSTPWHLKATFRSFQLFILSWQCWEHFR
jgi:hypothetical protein